jgi:hypothetical protein
MMDASAEEAPSWCAIVQLRHHKIPTPKKKSKSVIKKPSHKFQADSRVWLARPNPTNPLSNKTNMAYIEADLRAELAELRSAHQDLQSDLIEEREKRQLAEEDPASALTTTAKAAHLRPG